MTDELDQVCGRVFLRDQFKLVPKSVADNVEEALEFLEECGALVFDSEEELVAFMTEEGVDFDEDDLEDTLEVFPLPDGRYLYVEA